MKQNKMNINKINPAIRIAMALPLLALMVWSCSELGTPVSSKETEGSSLTEQEKQEPEAVAQDSLFTIALEPQLNEEQERLVAVIKNRPTTAELHFANLVNDHENLLKEGKTLGLPLSDQKLFVAVGERTAVNKLGYLSWIGKSENPLNTATLILSPEGEVGGTLRVEESIYQIEPLGDGVIVIILIDQSKFLPEHPPLNY